MRLRMSLSLSLLLIIHFASILIHSEILAMPIGDQSTSRGKCKNNRIEYKRFTSIIKSMFFPYNNQITFSAAVQRSLHTALQAIRSLSCFEIGSKGNIFISSYLTSYWWFTQHSFLLHSEKIHTLIILFAIAFFKHQHSYFILDFF